MDSDSRYIHCCSGGLSGILQLGTSNHGLNNQGSGAVCAPVAINHVRFVVERMQ